MKNFKVSPLVCQFGSTFEFFRYRRREYLEVLLLFLSFRYGADLGRSRLVFCKAADLTLNGPLKTLRLSSKKYPRRLKFLFWDFYSIYRILETIWYQRIFLEPRLSNFFTERSTWAFFMFSAVAMYFMSVKGFSSDFTALRQFFQKNLDVPHFSFFFSCCRLKSVSEHERLPLGIFRYSYIW